ncbi:MAG: serine/threonine-protein phosphatase [Bifidobacteriaceae bacterium]|jgi:serine/threonine protein phosphatase PrpC|nr:serine/threonine-protein phosphatase [Bifidobacteriaceae bacterium]
MSQPRTAGTFYTVTAEVCGRTETGPTRSQNQDAIVVAGAVTANSGTALSWTGSVPTTGLRVAVVDGMGGYAGGDSAAAVAANALTNAPLTTEPGEMDAWFEDLSIRIALAGQAWNTPAMGATVALLTLTPAGLVIANVGDCRIYRVIDGHMDQLSVDDRTEDPNSHAVTQALGGANRIDAHTWPRPYAGGLERYVLCSDGVWDTLSPSVLRDLCSAGRPPDQITQAIASSIYAGRARDNCSVVIVDLIATPTQVSPQAQREANPEPAAWRIGVRTGRHAP